VYFRADFQIPTQILTGISGAVDKCRNSRQQYSTNDLADKRSEKVQDGYVCGQFEFLLF
jgi:hypothetical protein